MQFEFSLFEWLTLYFWPLWGNGRNVNPSTTFPGESSSRRRYCEVSTLHLGKLCECTSRTFTFFWVIHLSFLTPLGYVESSNPPWPVSVSHLRSCEVSTLHLENCANARWIHVFGWLTLYSWPLWVNGRIVNPSTTCPGVSSTFLWSFNSSSWKLCECTPRTFTFFWGIYLSFLTPLGYVESSNPPWPVSVSHLRSCEVSTLHLENCANARWIHVFLGDWPFISDPYGGKVETSILPRPVPKSLRRSCEVSTLHLENRANARRIHVFGWLNLYFWPLWGNGRIVNPSTTCPGVSSTLLWSFNSISWKLCECTSNLRVWSD